MAEDILKAHVLLHAGIDRLPLMNAIKVTIRITSKPLEWCCRSEGVNNHLCPDAKCNWQWWDEGREGQLAGWGPRWH